MITNFDVLCDHCGKCWAAHPEVECPDKSGKTFEYSGVHKSDNEHLKKFSQHATMQRKDLSHNEQKSS